MSEATLLRHVQTDGLNEEAILNTPSFTRFNVFLWGYLKDRIYATRPDTIEALKTIIKEQCHEITRETLSIVGNFMLQRCERCIAAQG